MGSQNKPSVSIYQIQQTHWQCAYKTLWGTAIMNRLDSPLAYEKSCQCNHNLFAWISLAFFSEFMVMESYFHIPTQALSRTMDRLNTNKTNIAMMQIFL